MKIAFQIAAAIMLVAVLALAAVTVRMLAALPLETKSFAVEACSPDTGQLTLYNNGTIELPAGRLVLYDEAIGPLNTSLGMPYLAGGRRATVNASPLYAGNVYYLEYSRVPLARFIC